MTPYEWVSVPLAAKCGIYNFLYHIRVQPVSWDKKSLQMGVVSFALLKHFLHHETAEVIVAPKAKVKYEEERDRRLNDFDQAIPLGGNHPESSCR